MGGSDYGGVFEEFANFLEFFWGRPFGGMALS